MSCFKAVSLRVHSQLHCNEHTHGVLKKEPNDGQIEVFCYVTTAQRTFPNAFFVDSHTSLAFVLIYCRQAPIVPKLITFQMSHCIHSIKTFLE